jgi:hypothetical protein
MLRIGKSRFFVLLKEYRRDPEAFSIVYERATTQRLSAEVEAEIKRGLLQEKEIVQIIHFLRRLSVCNGRNRQCLRTFWQGILPSCASL